MLGEQTKTSSLQNLCQLFRSASAGGSPPTAIHLRLNYITAAALERLMAEDISSSFAWESTHPAEYEIVSSLQ